MRKLFLYTNLLIFTFLLHRAAGQVKFDYTGAELLINYFSDTSLWAFSKPEILNNPAYKLIMLHSQKFSSQPLTEENLLNSLKGKPDVNGFYFSEVKKRTDTLKQIIKFLKKNEQEIISQFASLPLNYLPADYKQNATIYIVIGGYNGIALNDKVCLNIDYKQFRDNFNEMKLYIAHELFHIGFEKYHPLPDIFKAGTVNDLKAIVLSMTMNEGLATLTPYQKRMEMDEVSDYDYKTLLDSSLLKKKLIQFQAVLKYLDDNIDKKLTEEILGNVLGQCSGDRLFYIAGCYMGLTIEKKSGRGKVVELIKEKPEKFFELSSQYKK